MAQNLTSSTDRSSIFFKPIDTDSELVRQQEIFREMGCEEASTPTFCRANPVSDQSCEDMELDQRHVISPYPFSMTTEELEEAKNLAQLTTELGWSVVPSDEAPTALFFQGIPSLDDMQDDFSISSSESSSLEEDEMLCLETISSDPAAFWEGGITPTLTTRAMSPTGITPTLTTRAMSPTEVSLGSDVSQTSRPKALEGMELAGL